MKQKESVQIISQERIGKDIYSMWIESEAARCVMAGQFISVYCRNTSKLLPRPISICQADKENQRLRIVYRVVGSGTKEISSYRTGDSIEIIGPLGRGFSKRGEKSAVLIGGGIGIAPLVQLANELNDMEENIYIQIVAGYRNELFLTQELQEYGTLYVATEDGSKGVKGTVFDAIRHYGVQGDVIYACGPLPMLREIKAYSIQQQMECQVSMEERMACGIGACLACVCRTKEQDEYSNVNYRRICKDGPVFDALEIEL